MAKQRVAIVGAGLAGLCTARELLTRGCSVTVYDRGEPGRGASWAAAGMLAPTFETATEGLDHPRLFDLLFEAAEYWRSWVDGEGGPTASSVGYRSDPLIALATTPGEAAAYERLVKFGRARNLTMEEERALGPMLASETFPAFALPEDGQADNRALVSWLLSDVSELGVTFVQGELADADLVPEHLNSDIIVDTRGWRAPGMTPVKGTAMSLKPHPGLPDRLVRWGRNYLVPKAGRTILGAHAMSGLTDTGVDPAIIEELLEEAAEVFPAVLEAEVLETWSGIRPRTRDGAPVMGWTGEGVYTLGGLYRDGVLLSPLLGKCAAEEIFGETRSTLVEAFRPSRFEPARP